MVSRSVIFLDDGGVMNDNQLRASQWQRLVSEFFTPLLGGMPEAWVEANRVISTRMYELGAWKARIQAASDYLSFDRAYQLDWLGGMCKFVGVTVPPEEECLKLAYRATASIIRRVHAAFPGAVDTIRVLHARGYMLHTASGEPSTDLDCYLDGMGVRNCFGRLYGPDLIDTFKEGPEYYEQIFADVGVAPADAVVVDDSVRAAEWAAQVGARTVLVGDRLQLETRTTVCVGSLAELPEVMQRLG